MRPPDSGPVQALDYSAEPELDSVQGELVWAPDWALEQVNVDSVVQILPKSHCEINRRLH